MGWLTSLLHYDKLGTGVSLIVTDTSGHLCSLQTLKLVTHGSTPLIDLLLIDEHRTHKNFNFCFPNTQFVLPMPRKVCLLTLPKSMMKQSPLLKLGQARGTWVARTTRLPLMWSSLWPERSFVTTWWKPEATPPVWGTENTVRLLPCLFIYSNLQHRRPMSQCSLWNIVTEQNLWKHLPFSHNSNVLKTVLNQSVFSTH